mmetsp:Transcript_990/g.2445  ORF Transcript_990/g.2445 Transcript_990/m.2445 type:complete len:201 (+) Transcript_990:498-1100(+)
MPGPPATSELLAYTHTRRGVGANASPGTIMRSGCPHQNHFPWHPRCRWQPPVPEASRSCHCWQRYGRWIGPRCWRGAEPSVRCRSAAHASALGLEPALGVRAIRRAASVWRAPRVVSPPPPPAPPHRHLPLQPPPRPCPSERHSRQAGRASPGAEQPAAAVREAPSALAARAAHGHRRPWTQNWDLLSTNSFQSESGWSV